MIDETEIIKRFYLSNRDYSALYFAMQHHKVRAYCLNHDGKEYFDPKDVEEWILDMRKIQNRNSETASYHQRKADRIYQDPYGYHEDGDV